MKALRIVIAVLVVTMSAVYGARVVYPRVPCNLAKEQISAELTAIRDDPEYRRIPAARELARECRTCLEKYPNDYHLQFLMGMVERQLGQAENAQESLTRAIELNARPEFYTNLGVVQLENGEAEEARRNILTAGLFSLRRIESVSEPLHGEVIAAVQNRYAQLRAKR